MKKIMLQSIAALMLCGIFTPAVHAEDVNAFRRFEINWNVVSFSRQGALNQLGGTLNFATSVNKRLAIVADVGVHQPTDPSMSSVRTTTYRFGPRLSMQRGNKVTTFGQVLVGGVRLSVPSAGVLSPTVDGFSMLVGSGVDIGVRPWFAVRVIEGGYSALRMTGDWSNGFRASGGIVFRFGQ